MEKKCPGNQVSKRSHESSNKKRKRKENQRPGSKEAAAAAAAAGAKMLQSCPTLCDPIDGSPPGSPVPGILQARTLEWVAMSFSNAWKWTVKVKLLSHVRLLATPWTAAYQAPPSMGFSRQEYWSGVPLPSPGKLGKSKAHMSKVTKLVVILFELETRSPDSGCDAHSICLLSICPYKKTAGKHELFKLQSIILISPY